MLQQSCVWLHPPTLFTISAAQRASSCRRCLASEHSWSTKAPTWALLAKAASGSLRGKHEQCVRWGAVLWVCAVQLYR